MIKNLGWLFIFLSLGSANSLFAREVIFGKSLEQITIVYGEETILRFPRLVKTVSNVSDFEISPVDKADPDYTLLQVKPIFRKSKGKVLFVLDDGAIVRVSLRTVKKGMPSKVDSFYEFISKESVVDKTQNITTISEIELIKAMIRGDQVTGYKLRNLVRTIWKTQKGLKARMIKVYTGKKFNGYVFKLENVSKKDTFKINPEKVFLGRPNQAILSQIDDVILYPKSKGKAVTYLRMVAKPTTVYSDIILPFDSIGGEKND